MVQGQRKLLKYCTICQQAWELDMQEKRLVRHQGMPSYGLKRETCSNCKESTTPPEPSLATKAQERHKKILQKIVSDNQELFKKNVKK